MTPALHLHILASGSKGNAVVVESADAAILIDCGLSRRELMRRANELGLDMEKVGALIVTHEHSDHVSGVSVFCNRFDGELFATAGTVAARSYLSERAFTIIENSCELDVCGIHVRVFPTSHDVADPIGLRFELDDDAIGLCTDTGFLTDAAQEVLSGVRILAIESNHDESMLAHGPYPAYLKDRISGSGGHLSNTQTASALPQLVGPDTETIVAMHLSQENNRASVCVRTLAEALGAEAANTTFTEARTPDGSISILAAGQDRPLSVY